MKPNRLRLPFLRAACAALLLSFAAVSMQAQDPKPPGKMAFQGFLTDKDGVARGNSSPANFTIIFRIYDSPTAAPAAALWAESQVVTVDKGHFSVVLGEGTSILGGSDLSSFFIGDNANGRYLGITVGNEAEIAPRIQFLTAPYAHLSRYATALVGSSGTSVLKTGAGSVGINLGAAQPASTLHVAGTVTATTFSGSGSGLTSLNGANLVDGSIVSAKIAEGTIANSKLAQITAANKVADSALSANVALRAGGNTFTGGQLFNSGNVAVGMQNGYARFAVGGTAGESQGVQIDNREIKFRGDGSAHWSMFANRVAGTWTFEDTSSSAGNGVAGSVRLALSKDGNVGVGTSTPTQAKFVVSGSVATTAPNMALSAFIAKSSAVVLFGGGDNMPLSIWASSDVAGNRFFAFSDERIKNITGRSNGARDLETLQGIEITDFQYKDVVGKGTAPQKKVIAQQLEKVFPQAVTKRTDVIPDIYKAANATNGWVNLATDLKTGDRIRLVLESGETLCRVLESDGHRFRTDITVPDGKLFVFGREVNDFRIVDYEAIAMLNVSATQQLKKEKDAEVTALKSENAELKARLERMESREKDRVAQLEQKGSQLDSLQRELDQLKKAVAQLAVSRQADSSRAVAASVNVSDR